MTFKSKIKDLNMKVALEHINVTLEDIDKAAQAFVDIFGWKIHWQGEALDKGRTIHVGNEETYVALYSHNDSKRQDIDHKTIGNLNHIGLIVDDLDAVESRVEGAGYKPYNHGNYEPGRRFYFDLGHNLEIEVVTYT